jgi:hypothetical protein
MALDERGSFIKIWLIIHPNSVIGRLLKEGKVGKSWDA